VRRLLAALLAVMLVVPVANARAVPFCERNPEHWKCVTPEPTPTPQPSPTPVSSPTPTVGWTLLFEDRFDSAIPEGQFLADGRWKAYPYGWLDTSKNGHYDPGIISVHDGAMDMHLRQINGEWRVAAPHPAVVGGRTSLRIEVRFRADPVAGFKTSWLLWPTSNDWPPDGEVDFPEGNLDGTIWAFMHRQGATTGSDQDAFSTTARYTEWHTAITEWDMGQRVAFYLDGQLLGVVTSRVPATPMRMVLQTETRLSGGAPPAGANAHVYVDEIRAWTR
jgi:hypothetical protein